MWSKQNINRASKYIVITTHPILVYRPHVLGNGLHIIWLSLDLSDLVQVQARQLKLLFTLGNLGIEIDQTLKK